MIASHATGIVPTTCSKPVTPSVSWRKGVTAVSDRFKKTAPLAVGIAIVAFLWSEFTLNFNLHWFTVADGVFGKFGLPENFQLVLPATFVTWGLYYALGANRMALRKTVIACITGTLGAVVIMTLGPSLAGLPSFWGIALAIALVGGGLELLSTFSQDGLLSAAPAFVCAASGAVLVVCDPGWTTTSRTARGCTPPSRALPLATPFRSVWTGISASPRRRRLGTVTGGAYISSQRGK
jgi:hypothetical protein